MSKQVVFIVAHKNFRDEEYYEPKKIIERAGVKVLTASSYLTPATGKLGGEAHVDLLFTEIKASEFEAIVFIGGPGVVMFWDDWRTQSLAKLFLEHNKVVAAICSAPVILARAGLLKDVTCTSFSGDEDKVRAEGGNWTGNEVEKDGLIITGNGPSAAKAFGHAIVDALS